MSLIQLWKTSPEQLRNKHLHQIIAFAGEGKLRDGNETSAEFRAFLSQVSSTMLAMFVDECLNASFTDSGYALQDVVNEVGRRLGFRVSNGNYQGRPGVVGYDGLWTLPTNHSVVVEVKTTDAYRIDTSKIAGYRRQLAGQGILAEEASSILMIVGRKDTGDLEAQIRGSRFAWEIRLISADALLRLMKLKETLDDPTTISRICEILIPKEYTRLDEIVDLVFSAAEEVKQEEEIEEPATTEEKKAATEGEKPAAFNDACIGRFVAKEGVALVRQSRSTYASPDLAARVVCSVSKTHGTRAEMYWFAFHPHQAEFLAGGTKGFVVLGCGTPERVLSLPFDRIKSLLDDLWTTERENGVRYWHIRIHRQGEKMWLDRKKGKGKLDISQYLLRS